MILFSNFPFLWLSLSFPLAIGYFLAYIFTFIFIKLARNFLLDVPGNRSSHSYPLPRGGGIVFVCFALFSSFICILTDNVSTLACLPLVCFPLAFVGFLDDLLNLSPIFRYFVQLITSFFIVLYSTDTSLAFGHSFFFFVLFVLLVFSCTGVINFVNFMDGLDGLVSGCMIVSLSVSFIFLNAPWPYFFFFGSLVAFFQFNWSPAKVFMGDVGSTFLGAMFFGTVLLAPNFEDSFGLLLIAFPLLGDAFICILRRKFTGQHVFQAHKLHLFQRLHQSGWSHSRVSALYISASSLLAIVFLYCSLTWVIFFAFVEFFVGVWLDQKVALPFVQASHN